MTLPGQAWGLAAAGPNGPVFATSYRGRDVAATVLTAVDAAGLVMWQRDFEGHPGPPRVSATGTDGKTISARIFCEQFATSNGNRWVPQGKPKVRIENDIMMPPFYSYFLVP